MAQFNHQQGSTWKCQSDYVERSRKIRYCRPSRPTGLLYWLIDLFLISLLCQSLPPPLLTAQGRILIQSPVLFGRLRFLPCDPEESHSLWLDLQATHRPEDTAHPTPPHRSRQRQKQPEPSTLKFKVRILNFSTQRESEWNMRHRGQQPLAQVTEYLQKNMVRVLMMNVKDHK